MNYPKNHECNEFFKIAKNYVMNSEYVSEIEHVRSLDFNKTTPEQFMSQFAFVVLNTGMKNQVAESMFKKLVESGWDPRTVNHEQKRDAIIKAINNYTVWFQELKSISNERGKIEYLQSLPFIGKITKYHLARNIGLDCAKPDRHLVLLAEKFDFETPRGMCEVLAQMQNERVGVIDVILWRYCNMNPNVIKKMKQDVLV